MEKVRIINRSNNAVLAYAEVARKAFPRMKGLLGRERLNEGEGLVITPCSSVHTVGMRFPIDVIFFDKQGRIIAVTRNMKPLRISAWHPRAAGVLEVAAGTVKDLSARPGDELVLWPVME